MQDDLTLVDIRNDLGSKESILIDRLHPDCLPNTCGAGVHTLELVEANILFTSWLFSGTCVAISMNDKRMFLPISEELRHIDGEGSAATKVSSCKPSVDKDLAVVIDGSEVEHHISACPVLWHLDVALVPDVVDKVRVTNAAELALRAERHSNLAVEALAFE